MVLPHIAPLSVEHEDLRPLGNHQPVVAVRIVIEEGQGVQVAAREFTGERAYSRPVPVEDHQSVGCGESHLQAPVLKHVDLVDPPLYGAGQGFFPEERAAV